MSSLRDKIEALILGLELSSTRFADVIGVKRPIISHILTERNKPSLDIIQKIVERFPELEYNWIGDDQDLDPEVIRTIKENNDFSASARESNGSGTEAGEPEILHSQAEPKPGRVLTKVMFFYSDDTFKVYSPEAFS
ncbi:helix-turn-helix domain-containing protein [Leadbetterella sp. DM7]|uniref:helix-turn-helix domain-containing protein n=1 Tax=Leadbetterella sp. DM7 TaxID=3235085 RepID=UPI00349E4B7A